MKRTLYCERCGRQHIANLADRYVDDEYLCMPCFKAAGYGLDEGEKIIQKVSMTLTSPVDIRPLRKSSPRRNAVARPAARARRVVLRDGERAIRQPRANNGQVKQRNFRPVLTLNCANCGKTVTTTDPRRKCCSATCRLERLGKMAKEGSYGVRVCPYRPCGQEFTATTPHQKFCCKSHATAYWHQHTKLTRGSRAKTVPAERNCEYCGKAYTPKRVNHNRFCRRNCKVMWHQRAKRQAAQVATIPYIQVKPDSGSYLGLERQEVTQ